MSDRSEEKKGLAHEAQSLMARNVVFPSFKLSWAPLESLSGFRIEDLTSDECIRHVRVSFHLDPFSLKAKSKAKQVSMSQITKALASYPRRRF
jgi:hypothetical protein